MQQSGPVYPGAHWRQTAAPEAVGWSADLLAEARVFSETIGSAAVMIVQGRIVVDAWGDIARKFQCHSIRKSLLSALIGVAAYTGDLVLSQTLADLAIDDTEPALTPREKLATVADLLTARSGIYHPDIMVVKAQGEFVWHKHDDTDDFFFVLKGRLTIQLRDRAIHLEPGELFVVSNRNLRNTRNPRCSSSMNSVTFPLTRRAPTCSSKSSRCAMSRERLLLPRTGPLTHVQGGVAWYAGFLYNHNNIKYTRSTSSCRSNDRRLHEQATEEPGCAQCMTFSSEKRRLCRSSLVSQPKIVPLCQYPLNVGFKAWPKIFNQDNTLTAAILDRLLHHAETVIIEGKSFRMKDQIES